MKNKTVKFKFNSSVNKPDLKHVFEEFRQIYTGVIVDSFITTFTIPNQFNMPEVVKDAIVYIIAVKQKDLNQNKDDSFVNLVQASYTDIVSILD